MKTYKSIEKSDLDYFLQLLGPEKCSVNSEDLEKYGQDETEGLVFLPELVLKPSETNEVSAILKYCYQHNICVTPRGAGTGLSGGALPVHGGISLSTEKMNKILDIDEKNLQVLTQPGVITQVLQETVAAKGLYYPPDPSSRGS